MFIFHDDSTTFFFIESIEVIEIQYMGAVTAIEGLFIEQCVIIFNGFGGDDFSSVADI